MKTPTTRYAIPHSALALTHAGLFWVLQAVGWMGYGLAVLGQTRTDESLEPAVVDTIVFVVIGCLLTSLYRLVYRDLRRRALSLPKLGVAILLSGIIGVPLWWWPQALLARLAHATHPFWVVELPGYSHIPSYVWFMWSTVLFGWSFLYFAINDGIDLQAERRRSATAESSAQEARLQALHAQLQPHFLFNTLNSISALIVDDRSRDAAAMIAGLGALLRLALQSADSPLIPLERELAFLRQYLEIEKMRFGARLNYRVDAAPETMDALIPTLLLQPLVENAVRHGILPQQQGGTVVVSAHASAQTLNLQVADDGRGWEPAGAPISGIGLVNTARRLEELYGARGKLVVGRGEAGGVKVEISIPLQYGERSQSTSRTPKSP